MYTLDWLSISAKKLENITKALEKVFDVPIRLENLGPTLKRVAGYDYLAIVEYGPIQVFHLQFSAAAFDFEVGFDIGRKVFLEILSLEPDARIARVDLKSDRPGQAVPEVIPRRFLTTKFFVHRDSWDFQIYGDPYHSIRFLHEAAKIRIYSKIEELYSGNRKERHDLQIWRF